MVSPENGPEFHDLPGTEEESESVRYLVIHFYLSGAGPGPSMKEQAQLDSPVSGQGYAAAQFASWQRTIPFESDMTGHTRRFTVRPVDLNMAVHPARFIAEGMSFPDHNYFTVRIFIS